MGCGHGERRYPTAQHCVQDLPVLHTLPSSTWEPLEASGNDAVAIKDSVPGTSPPWATLAPPASRRNPDRAPR